MCCGKQPSSEHSEPDEPAELAEADTVDELSKDEMRELSAGPVSSSAAAAGTPDQQASTADATATTDMPRAPEHELIDPNDALKALRAFVEENNKHRVRRVILFFFFLSCRVVVDNVGDHVMPEQSVFCRPDELDWAGYFSYYVYYASVM